MDENMIHNERTKLTARFLCGIAIVLLVGAGIALFAPSEVGPLFRVAGLYALGAVVFFVLALRFLRRLR